MQFSGSDNSIDLSQVAARIEELEDEEGSDEQKELAELRSLVSMCGDETDGTLINVDAWRVYVWTEFQEERHAVDIREWPFNCIDWDEAADQRSTDYTSIDWDGGCFYLVP